MIGVRTTGDLQAIADRLAELDECSYVVITAGSFEIMAEVVCRNDDHLLEILQRIRTVEGVLSTERSSTSNYGNRPTAGVRHSCGNRRQIGQPARFPSSPRLAHHGIGVR